MTNLKITPTAEEFALLAQKADFIAVETEVNLDLDTPVSIYYKLVGEDKGFILESVDTTQQQFGRYSFIGAEPFVRLQVFKNRLMINEDDLMRCIDGDPVTTLKKFAADFTPAVRDKILPLAAGGMVGYLNYEIAATFDRIRGVNIDEGELLGQFMICRVLVVSDALKNTARLICFARVNKDNAAKTYDELTAKLRDVCQKLYDTNHTKTEESSPSKETTAVINFREKYGEAPADYLAGIAKAKEHIFAGDIFQVVPSRQFRVNITKKGFLFYRRLRQGNPSPYMFYLNFGGIKLVGASPEMLVKVMGGTVYTYPIAGTRKRGQTEAEDLALEKELLSDEKECAEHSMLVDLARNDIGRISEAGSVIVTKLKKVERFSHVMHMVSEVQGKLVNAAPPDVLKATFPAGTVSGAPKLRAMEIINELEPVKRETYAGTVGYMDFCGNMDMCITLRTMRIENDTEAVIQSGGGIVADSVPQAEYREILQKSGALFQVVEEVESGAVAFRQL